MADSLVENAAGVHTQENEVAWSQTQAESVRSANGTRSITLTPIKYIDIHNRHRWLNFIELMQSISILMLPVKMPFDCPDITTDVDRTTLKAAARDLCWTRGLQNNTRNYRQEKAGRSPPLHFAVMCASPGQPAQCWLNQHYFELCAHFSCQEIWLLPDCIDLHNLKSNQTYAIRA